MSVVRTRLVDPWRISLWALRLLLAAVFGDDGFAKATESIDALAETCKWPGDVSEGLVRAIGSSELVAALSLVLPMATRILPYLTPLAAAFLGLLMWASLVYDAMRGDWQRLTINVVLGVLTTFVVWGRFAKAPVSSRFDN
jgi:hypothetical protein